MQTENFQFDLKVYLKILKRRKLLLIIPFLLIFSVSTVVAVLLPPMYRSEAMILVETQDVPQEFIKTTVTGYVAERLQVLNQLVTARDNLMKLVEEHNLYPELRKEKTPQEIVKKFRQDIHMSMIQSEEGDAGGRGTIAFRLAYTGENPGTVYKIANALTSLFIEKNLEIRSEKVTETYKYLEERKKILQEEIDDLEKKLAAFKRENVRTLPGNMATTVNTMSELQQEIRAQQKNIEALQEKRLMLEEELEMVLKDTPTEFEEQEEVKQLRKAYVSARASKSENHPDVLKLKKQLEAFEAEMGTQATYNQYLKDLEEKKKQLLKAEQDYTEGHPDVKRLKQEVKTIRSKLDELSGSLEEETVESDEQPPAVRELKRQLRVVDFQMKGEKENLKLLNSQLQQYQGRLDVMPSVEREYTTLTRDLSLARAKYNDIAVKLLAAREAKGLEDSHLGEKLTIIDPPGRPGEPFKPNRKAIVVLGLFLGMGFGIGSGALAETMDNSFREPRDIVKKINIPVLATFPEIKNKKEKRKSKIKLLLAVLLFVLLMAGVLIYLHLEVMPLDIIYLTIQERFGV